MNPALVTDALEERVTRMLQAPVVWDGATTALRELLILRRLYPDVFPESTILLAAFVLGMIAERDGWCLGDE